jgi:DNA polymerase-3 subunit epsilon
MASRRLLVPFLVAGLVSTALCLTLLVLAGMAARWGQDVERVVLANAMLAAIVLGGGFAGAWYWVRHRLGRRATALAEETQLIARANPRHTVDAGHYADLAPVPAAINELAARLRDAREDADGRVAAATGRLAEQKGWLEAILTDLTEGVVVCNMNHQVLLYNQVALKLLQVAGEIGLGRSLFNLVTRQPILHALELLTFRLRTRGPPEAGDATAPVVCASGDARTLLRGRIGLILSPQRDPAGYVLTFSDVTQEIATLGKRDALLTAATEGMRAPLANLRAAVETVAAYPAMPAEERARFDQVIVRESNALSERLEAVAAGYRDLVAGHWPMAPIYSLDLLTCVVQRAGEDGGVSLVGLPVWLHGDSYGLMLALTALLAHLRRRIGGGQIDLGTVPGERRHYIDFAWAGAPVPSAEIDRWMGDPLDPSAGSLTLRDVLDRHRSEVWSQPAAPGRAILRLPVAAAERPPAGAGAVRRPPRPEYYDFALMHQALPGAAQGDRKLKELSFVVFDTETTGLDAARGDEIVSIAAVRIVNGRILTGETFERLVDPKRPIPASSTAFHGITDEMVQGKPPIHVVLPQFRSFVADSVLVAHNAAFDLSFIRPKEAEAAVVFRNPVLDTQLLGAYLLEHVDDNSLDGLAQRFGVEIVGRHTAAGDALMTAAVFLREIELLEARGVTTLSEAIGICNVSVERRARQAQA